jgi:hypothetical protein
MKKGGRVTNLAMLVAVAALVYLLFTMNNKSATLSKSVSTLPMAWRHPSVHPPLQSKTAVVWRRAPVSPPLSSHGKLRPPKTSVSSLQKTSSLAKTSSSHANKLVSQKPSVVLSATRTNKSVRNHQTPRNHSFGTTLPLSQTL